MASGTNSGFLHAVFGLRLRSAFALPELTALSDDGRPPDVTLERGRIPARLQGAVNVDPAMQAAAGRFQLDVPAGRFRVSEGRRILVDARPGATDADLRPYLLGTVMGALCHQRGLLPLHAAAILSTDGAAAFAGPSGVGKSTLAAQLHGRGRAALADDLLAIEIDAQGTPRAHPGVARIRLSTGTPGAGKVSLPIAGMATDRAWPLRRFYRLDADGGDPPELCRLHGPEAVSAIRQQIYRWPIAAAMGQAAACFAQCVGVASRCEVFDVNFTHAAGVPALLAQAIEDHLAPLGASFVWRGGLEL
jgi:hypothetical protein